MKHFFTVSVILVFGVIGGYLYYQNHVLNQAIEECKQRQNQANIKIEQLESLYSQVWNNYNELLTQNSRIAPLEEKISNLEKQLAEATDYYDDGFKILFGDAKQLQTISEIQDRHDVVLRLLTSPNYPRWKLLDSFESSIMECESKIRKITEILYGFGSLSEITISSDTDLIRRVSNLELKLNRVYSAL